MVLVFLLNQNRNETCKASVGIGRRDTLSRSTSIYNTIQNVCKQWKKLFETKSFVNNHLLYAHPQFLLWEWYNSKVYSVSVTLKNNPKIEVCELHLQILSPNEGMDTSFFSCDGLLSCIQWPSDNKFMVVNPWLRQTRLTESEEPFIMFRGIVYASGKSEKGLKIFGSIRCNHNEGTWQGHRSIVIYNFETNEWTFKCFDGLAVRSMSHRYSVSFDGNLYWILPNRETNMYFIESFDFSKEIFREEFCVLPWDKNTCSLPMLSTFRKDRFLVLTKFRKTNNIDILVTKNKVNIDDGENVEWMKFMSVSVPISGFPSYFIDDVHNNSLVICCKDENGKLCIYIVRNNRTTKIHIGFDADHCSYVPSLIPVP